MKKHVAFLMLTSALLTACSTIDSLRVFDNEEAARLLQQNSTSRPTRQRIAINLPDSNAWQRIDLSFGTKGSPIMLVPKQQTYADWNESVRTQIKAYYHFPDITAKDFVAQKIQQAKQECKHVEAQIITANKSYSLYRLNIANCRIVKNQLQIGKAFNGVDAVYVVYYAADLTQISDAEVKRMSGVIAATRLVAKRTT
jgi:hypothetical protein